MLLDDLADRVLHAFVVAIEHLDDLVMRDRRHPLEPDVVVGDERDVDVAHLELARQVSLGILRHVDDLPALALKPLRFGARREARPLDHDDRAALVRLDCRVERSASIAIGRSVGQYGSAKLTCVVIGPS